MSGTITRPLFDELKASREKLAYVLDSTCAPKAILVPLNTWGAYVIGLLIAQDIENPVATLLGAVPFNVYSILAVAARTLCRPHRLEHRTDGDRGAPV